MKYPFMNARSINHDRAPMQTQLRRVEAQNIVKQMIKDKVRECVRVCVCVCVCEGQGEECVWGGDGQG